MNLPEECAALGIELGNAFGEPVVTAEDLQRLEGRCSHGRLGHLPDESQAPARQQTVDDLLEDRLSIDEHAVQIEDQRLIGPGMAGCRRELDHALLPLSSE